MLCLLATQQTVGAYHGVIALVPDQQMFAMCIEAVAIKPFVVGCDAGAHFFLENPITQTLCFAYFLVVAGKTHG